MSTKKPTVAELTKLLSDLQDKVAELEKGKQETASPLVAAVKEPENFQVKLQSASYENKLDIPEGEVPEKKIWYAGPLAWLKKYRWIILAVAVGSYFALNFIKKASDNKKIAANNKKLAEETIGRAKSDSIIAVYTAKLKALDSSQKIEKKNVNDATVENDRVAAEGEKKRAKEKIIVNELKETLTNPNLTDADRIRITRKVLQSNYNGPD